MDDLNIRGSRAKRRRRPPRHLGWLIALGAAVPVLVTGYGLAAPGVRSAAPTADVRDVLAGTTSPAAPVVGGWGEGGYPMMPMPGSPAGAAPGFLRNRITANIGR